MKSPPASVILKDFIKAEKGSGEPNKNKIGKVTMAQCREMAKEKGKEEESEAYEAHAVLLSLHRKQQDSAPAVVKIAEELGDKKMAAAGRKMKRELDASTKELGELLADFAVRIVKQPDKK